VLPKPDIAAAIELARFGPKKELRPPLLSQLAKCAEERFLSTRAFFPCCCLGTRAWFRVHAIGFDSSI
jgi:hypothetical protein